MYIFYKIYNHFQNVRFYKRIYLFFIFLLIFQLIFACNNLFSSKVTLSFLVQHSDVENWQPQIQEFESRHPDITIELVNDKGIKPNYTDGLREEYIKSFKDESFPVDLVFIDIIWLPEYAENNWLMPLDKDFPDLSDFFEYEVESGKYNNHLYRIPFRSDVGVLFYRKDLLKELNLSSLWVHPT